MIVRIEKCSFCDARFVAIPEDQGSDMYCNRCRLRMKMALDDLSNLKNPCYEIKTIEPPTSDWYGYDR